jgi:RNA polymerase sigma-70 factor, ECF subfamily
MTSRRQSPGGEPIVSESSDERPLQRVPLRHADGPGAGRSDKNDARLWSRVRAGDADAFALVFESEARAIYNFCFRRIGEWAAAEDLMSVVFLEAWRLRTKNRAPEFGRAWLFGIATNVIRNRRRAEWRYRKALASIPREHAAPDFADDVESRLDAEAAMKGVLAAVAELPQRERDVLALCAWSGLSYEETAIALGVPIGTVRSRLSRARARLRELDASRGHSTRESI